VDLDLDPVAGDTFKLISLDWPDVPLMELRARRDSGRVPGMELLVVEWLRLQNPAATFTPGRPRLPGQDHPGMGLLKEVFAILILMCERLDLDGLLIVAGHYHLVALSDDLLRFLDPDQRTRFRAMREALAGLSVARASELIDAGALEDADTGAPVRWEPIAMVLPVRDRFREWLEARGEARRPSADPVHAPRFRLRAPDAASGPVA
jgi:hypothetical protein